MPLLVPLLRPCPGVLPTLILDLMMMCGPPPKWIESQWMTRSVCASASTLPLAVRATVALIHAIESETYVVLNGV